MKPHKSKQKLNLSLFTFFFLIRISTAEITDTTKKSHLTDSTTTVKINVIKCNDYDCLKCSTAAKCDVCKNGFFLDSKSGECKVCGAGCISCYETGACHTCDTDYNLQGNGTCEYDSWGWLPWVLIVAVILIALAGLYFLIKAHRRRRYAGGEDYFELDESMHNSRLFKYGGVPISQTNLNIDGPHYSIWDDEYDAPHREKRRYNPRKSRFIKSRAKRSNIGFRRKKKSYYEYMEDDSDDFDYSPPRYFYTPERLKKKRMDLRVTSYNPYIGNLSPVPSYKSAFVRPVVTPLRVHSLAHSQIIPPSSRITRFSAPSTVVSRVPLPRISIS